jgi:hypothetical protein
MPQIFKHSTNLISRVSIYGSAVFVVLAGYVIYALTGSPFVTDVNVAKDQPVPFSHKHHAGELGIDCRYCHTSVEQSSFAGLPPTQTCMTCHSQIWIKAPILEPVRASYRDDKSLEWNRVNALPDFVYFNHSIHVAKGVGCTTCHGPIAEMPLTWAANTLQMSWCLGCHREPEKFVRPKEYVFSTTYEPPSDQVELGKKLLKEYNVHTSTDCYTCHR